jgi:mRNA interferase MazF
MSKYKQGDIVIISFPFTDLSRTKKRPALIISNDLVNKTSDYLMVQISSVEKYDDLSISISNDDFVSKKSLPLKSFIRIHKVFLLNERLILYKASSVTGEFLKNTTDEIFKLIVAE